MTQIKIKRGIEANRTQLTPATGEPIWTTDKKELWVGDGATQGGVPVGTVRSNGGGVSGKDTLALYEDTTGKVLHPQTKDEFLKAYSTSTQVDAKITSKVPAIKVHNATHADKATDSDKLGNKAASLYVDNSRMTSNYTENSASKVVTAAGIRKMNSDIRAAVPSIKVAHATLADTATNANKLGNQILTTAATANTVASRDSSGDINVRMVRSNYANQGNISGAIAYRTNTTDNYIRFCSDVKAIRNYLGAIGTDEVITESAGSWAGVINKIPRVRTDGVMEVGKYIDLHEVGSTSDYDTRIATDNGIFDVESSTSNMRFDKDGTLTLKAPSRTVTITSDGNMKGAQWRNYRLSDRVFNTGIDCPSSKNVNNRVHGWTGVQTTSALYLECFIDGRAAGVTYFWSDRNLKKAIKDTQIEALPLVDKFKFREFEWDETKGMEQGKWDLGLIAQEVKEVKDDLTFIAGKGTSGETMSLDTNKLLLLSLKANQELSNKNKNLEARLATIEAKLGI